MPTTRSTSVHPAKAERTDILATPKREKSALPARPAQRGSRKPILLTASLGVLLVIGIGVYMVARSTSPSSAGRPIEATHIERVRTDEPAREASKRPAEAINVPAPQGTVRRMEAISKAFK